MAAADEGGTDHAQDVRYCLLERREEILKVRSHCTLMVTACSKAQGNLSTYG